jgi:hypothetical protein
VFLNVSEEPAVPRRFLVNDDNDTDKDYLRVQLNTQGPTAQSARIQNNKEHADENKHRKKRERS